MPLYISDRLGSYLRPIIFLAIALYGLHSCPTCLLLLTLQIGIFLILLEIVTFQIRPKDVLSLDKLKDRIFGKVWLRVGMSTISYPVSTWSVAVSSPLL